MRHPNFKTAKYEYVMIQLMLVAKVNFNDQYDLETSYISLDELNQKEPVWFNPYGKYDKTNCTSVALMYCSDEEYVFLEQVDGTEKERKGLISTEYICCKDVDTSSFLAAHISFVQNKKRDE